MYKIFDLQGSVYDQNKRRICFGATLFLFASLGCLMLPFALPLRLFSVIENVQVDQYHFSQPGCVIYFAGKSDTASVLNFERANCHRAACSN